MSVFVEYVTYKAGDTSEEELFELRRHAILDVKSAHPDLLSVPCIVLKDGRGLPRHLDLRDQGSRRRRQRRSRRDSRFVAFFAVLIEVEIRGGEMPDSARDPL